MNRVASASMVGVFVMLTVGAGSALGQHEGDVWVGRTASGQMTVSLSGYVPDENYYSLTEVNGPILWGWTDNSPGFDRLVAAEPEDDVYPLEAGAQIYLEVVEVDPALRMIDGAFQVLDEPGEDTYLGDHMLHVHNIWHIDSNGPGYIPEQCVWEGTFVLRDDGSTGYATSGPLTFRFTNMELSTEPGDFDGDDDVDLADYAAFADCTAGPDLPPAPAEGTCEAELQCHVSFDFDDDGDIDLQDFAAFQGVFTS